MQPRPPRRSAHRLQAWRRLGLSVVLVGLATAPVVGAEPWAPKPLVEWRGTPDPPRSGISLDRAVAMAEQHFKARVVRTGTSDADGRRVYVLRLLSDQGRVWTVRVDAETGAMN